MKGGKNRLSNKARKLFKELRDLIFRKYPTEYHREAWSSFEKICMYRSNLGQIEKLINSLLLIAFGKANFYRAEEFILENSEESLSGDNQIQ